MSVIDVRLETQTWQFDPGQIVSGEASWTLDRQAMAIEISLIWYTSGKGNTDECKPFTTRLERPPPRGRQPFSVTLPTGPYSFSGRLVTLSWAVQAMVLPEKLRARREIVLAPGRVEINLP